MRRLLILLGLLLFGGCSSKSYFEPQEIAGKVRYEGRLPAEIVDVVREGATLRDGHVITVDGLSDVKLKDGYLFVGRGEGAIAASKECGSFLILDTKTKRELYFKKFDRKRVAVAKIRGDIAALIFDNNEIAVLDFKRDEILFSQKGSDIYAVDTKMAPPYFLGELILFPTLDGKILIVDYRAKRAIRSIIVGTEKYFNNIIFMDVIDDRLVAATKKRVVSVNPKEINTIDVELNDVLYVKGAVYILATDGTIIMTDPDLNRLKSKKFPFAHFTGMIYGEYLYVIEKEGYVIATDHSLRIANVFELEEPVKKYIFAAKDRLYYEDRYLKLDTDSNE